MLVDARIPRQRVACLVPAPQIFLGIFRSWLRLVAWGLSMLGTVLRLMGTGCTVSAGCFSTRTHTTEYRTVNTATCKGL